MAKTRAQYIAEHDEDGLGDVTFSLVDKATVDRLRKTGDVNLPKKKVSIPKDKAWNTKQMNSRLLQGIENGYSIDKIARSIFDIVDKNEASSVRNARTMVTGAENLGRLDSYADLEEQGVVQKKVWIATPDDRTRISHLELDGEEVDIDEEFSNGCMCPGDPDCDDPSEVWNCRCSMRDHIVGFRKADGSISYIERQRDETLHDEQIEEEKERREEALKGNQINMGKTIEGYDDDSIEEMTRFVSEAEGLSGDIYLQFSDQMNAVVDTEEGNAYYSHEDKCVHLNIKEDTDGDGMHLPFETHFHEYGHNIDELCGNISQNYRDAEGRRFDEIIKSDWDNLFKEKATLDNLKMNIESEYGVGANSWARMGLSDYASENGLSLREGVVGELREQLRGLETDEEIIKFVENNIDIFANVRYTDNISKDIITDFCQEMKDKYTLNERHCLSDMFERYSVKQGGPDYPFGAGHGANYAGYEWSLGTEAFAEMFASEIVNHESLDLIKEYLPQSYSAFQDMLRSIKS